MSNSYQTHPFNSMNHLIHISCSPNVKTHKSQLTHHPIHKGHSVHIFNGNTHTSILSTFEIKESIKSNRLLAQLLAQAEGSRPSEEDPRSSELPSPRRELIFKYSGLARVLTHARLPLPKRDVRSLKNAAGRLGNYSWKIT